MSDSEEATVQAVEKRPRGNPNLAAAREKALEARQKKALVTKAAKLQKKELEDAYTKAKEFLEPKAEPIETPETPVDTPAPIEKPKPKKKRTKVTELTDSSSSESESESEEESDSDSSVEEVKIVRKPKSKASKTKPKASKSKDELTGAVARDMLRSKLFRDAENSAIRALFPNWKG